MIMIKYLLLALLLSSRVSAQSWKGYTITQPAANCNINQISSDSYLGDHRGYVKARRYQLHIISISTSIVASYAVKKVFHTSTVKASLIGGLGVGILPHFSSVIIRRRYPINPGDMLGDAAMRMIPFVSVVNRKSIPMAILTDVSMYLGSMCWVSP